MINKNLINIFLLIASVFVIAVIVLPSYNGKGYNSLGISGAVQSYYKNKNIEEHLRSAKDLSYNSEGEVSGYLNISQDYLSKLNQSMPLEKDIVRNINDIDILAKENKLKINSIKFTKPLQLKNTKSHTLTMSAKGDYFAFSNFIKKLETSLEIYSIKNLTINTDPLENDLNYTLVLETYEINK